MGKDLKGKELGKGFSQRKDLLYSFRWTNCYGRQEIYSADLSTLKRMARRSLAEDEFNMSSSNKNMTVDELFNSWINVYMKHDLKYTTRENYISTFNRYLKNNVIGKAKVSSITPLIVKREYNRFAETYSQSICGTIHSILKGVFDLAVIEGIIFTNRINSLKIKSIKHKKVVSGLSDENLSLFIEYSKDSFFFNLYMLIINTGMRVGEVVALQFEDLDFTNKVIHIRHNLQYHRTPGLFDNGKKFMFGTPKNNEERDVPMNDTTYTVLENQLKQLELIKQGKLRKNCKDYKSYDGFEKLLFITRTGAPILRSSISKDIDIIIERIKCDNHGIDFKKFSPHVLRHTFATSCISNGIDANTLREYLGHANINLTMGTYVDAHNLNGEILKLDHLYQQYLDDFHNKKLA